MEVSIIRDENNMIITNWYRKPIMTGCYINYFSYHSVNQKLCIDFMLVDTALKLSNHKFHDSNLGIVQKLLIQND